MPLFVQMFLLVHSLDTEHLVLVRAAGKKVFQVEKNWVLSMDVDFNDNKFIFIIFVIFHLLRAQLNAGRTI